MTNVYISVTSHNNDQLIEENFFNIPETIGDFKISVYVIDNTNSKLLKIKCKTIKNLYYFFRREFYKIFNHAF